MIPYLYLVIVLILGLLAMGGVIWSVTSLIQKPVPAPPGPVPSPPAPGPGPMPPSPGPSPGPTPPAPTPPAPGPTPPPTPPGPSPNNPDNIPERVLLKCDVDAPGWRTRQIPQCEISQFYTEQTSDGPLYHCPRGVCAPGLVPTKDIQGHWYICVPPNADIATLCP